MMRAKAVNPGNINVRLGAVLQKMEDALDAGDLAKGNNLLRRVRTYVGVHMTPDQKEDFNAMPAFQYGDGRTMGELQEALEDRLEYLLAVARDAGIFSKPDLEVGDASSLDDEDPEMVPP